MSTIPARQQGEKYCADCGSIINSRAEICPRCGVRQMPAPNAFGRTTSSGKSKIAAGLFAILLGGLGIHKFYLGRVGQGILYILFCWTFIPSIIALVEGIIYFAMSDETFEQKYG